MTLSHITLVPSLFLTLHAFSSNAPSAESREVKRIEPPKFAPHPRAGHSVAAIDDKGFIIHGGYSDDGLFGDFWFFDTRALRLL